MVVSTISPSLPLLSVAKTSDFTVVFNGTPSSSATSAQVDLPGVGVLAMACVAGGHGPACARASAFSMFAA